ncbi:MAG: AMP-binding protein [Sporolactobacillus sp.]
MSQLTRELHEHMKPSDRSMINEGNHWYSAGELQSEIKRIQAIMVHAGIEKGDRVVLGLPNSYSFLCFFLAIIDYGAVVATINPEMTDTEFKRFIQRCRPVHGFVHDRHAAVLFDDSTVNALSSLCVYHGDLSDLSFYFRTSQRWIRGWEAEAAFDTCTSVEPSEDETAILLYTSGTTGAPKAVGLTHRQVYAAARHIIASHRLSASDRAYNILPLFHINAQVVTVLSTLLSGGQIIMAPKFSASKFWNVVIQDKVTWVSAVPAIISILLKIPKPTVIPDSLRMIRSASAPLAPQLAKQFDDVFGIPLIQSYGMTEAASQICVNPLPPMKRKPASVGIPYGLELKVVDDQDQELACGKVGELTIRGDNVIRRYEDGAGKDAFQDGWFHTGDVGWVDEDGYVFISGRKKELINRGGEKISPYEVEQVIRTVSGIKQAAVIGLDDPKYGERVAAYIVAEEKVQTDRQELIRAVWEQCKRSLSAHKWPETIEFLPEIPTGPTGKVQRSLLKHHLLVQNLEIGRINNHA